MATIGKLSYIISANTTAFVRAMVASRTEATLQKKILEQMRSPLDDWAEAETRLKTAMGSGAITTDQAAFALQKLNAQHPAAIAAANAQADADRQASEEARRLANAVDQVTSQLTQQIATMGMSADELARHKLAQQGATQEQLDSVAALQAQAGAAREAAAAERTKAQAMGQVRQQAAAAVDRARSPLDKYREEISLLKQAGVSQAEFTARKRELAAALPQVQSRLAAQATALREQAAQAKSAAAALRQEAVQAKVNYQQIGEGIRHVAGTVTVFSGAITGSLGMIGRELLRTAERSSELDRMQASIGGLKAEFGNLLQDALRPAYSAIGDLADGFRSLDSGTKTTITYIGLFAFEMGFVVTAAASGITVIGQMVVSYGYLTKTAIGAAIAQKGLNAAVGVGYAAAAVAAVGAGYAIGSAIYAMSQEGQKAARIYRDLADSVQSIAGVDFAGANAEDLQGYIAATDKQIAGIRKRNDELKAGQGVSNLWQWQADVIAANNQQVEQLQANLGRAQHAWAAMQPDTSVVEAQVTLREQVESTTGAIREQREAVNEWADSLAQSMTPLLPMQIPDPMAGLNPQMTGTDILGDFATFQEQSDQQQAAIAETTKRLQEQIATAGMSTDQVERWKLAQQGATPEQLAGVAALQQRAGALKDVTQEQRTAIAASNGWSAATRGSSEATERIKEYRRMLASSGAGPHGRAGLPDVNEGPPPRPGQRPAKPAGGTPAESSSELLAKAVLLLNRIAVASEKEPFTVEQAG
jgi:hypothetical protein